MAKAHSPLRLEETLVEQAKVAGVRLHRSTAEQIEYWADLGRSVAKVLTPDNLLQIYAGVATIKVEPVNSPDIDPDALFGTLEQYRGRGLLASSITTSAMKYQASTEQPGMLEQVAPDGSVAVGQFNNGRFVPASELKR
jgi:hypothetical protein